MKSIRRVIREHKEKVHSLSVRLLKPRIGKIGEKLRLPGRIRLANLKAGRHPKKFAVWSIAILTGLFLSSMLMPIPETVENVSITQGIVSLEQTTSGLEKIQRTRAYHKSLEIEMAIKGGEIKRSLDSLLNLPVKTTKDSMEIVKYYRQLKIITQNLNSDEDEKN